LEKPNTLLENSRALRSTLDELSCISMMAHNLNGLSMVCGLHELVVAVSFDVTISIRQMKNPFLDECSV